MSERRGPEGVALALHGGAGRILRGRIDADAEREMRELASALLAEGVARLEAGAPALDVAERVVAALEDSPHFNAGLGSALTSAGEVEMDAALLDAARVARSA